MKSVAGIFAKIFLALTIFIWGCGKTDKVDEMKKDVKKEYDTVKKDVKKEIDTLKKDMSKNDTGKSTGKLVCVLSPTKGNNVKGTVMFYKDGKKVRIEGEITGLTPG